MGGEAGRGCPSVAHGKGSCLESWTQPAGLVIFLLAGGRKERPCPSFLLPGTACSPNASLLPSSTPQPAEARLHGQFLAPFTGRRLGGRAGVARREEGPQEVCFPALASPGRRAVRSPRLATGNRRPWTSPSERLEFGGVFLGFCFICMFARVILFSLPAFVLTYCGKVTPPSVKPLPLRASGVHHDPPAPDMGGSPCPLPPPATHSPGGLTSGPQPPAALRGWWTV